MRMINCLIICITIVISIAFICDTIAKNIVFKNYKCLHCGENKARYCEKCYQSLIAENMELQLKIKELEK